MKIKISTLLRSVAELRSDEKFAGLKDAYGLLDRSEYRLKTFEANPFLQDKNQPAQIIGVDSNGVVFGYIGPFPINMIADGQRLVAIAGDDLFVHQDYRKSGYALELMERIDNMSTDKISINTGLSDMAQRMCSLLDHINFKIIKFAYIKRINSLLSVVLSPRVVKWVAPIANSFLFLWRKFISIIAYFKTPSLCIKDVENISPEVLEEFQNLIQKDEHKFRQEIDSRWLKWVMENDFLDDAKKVKRLISVSTKGGVVGYFLVRTSPRSGRCRIIEWQLNSDYARYEQWIMLRVCAHLVKSADFVALSMSDADSKNYKAFKRLLFRTKNQMLTIGVGEESPLKNISGYDQAQNWRIRPGMGDSCFYG